MGLSPDVARQLLALDLDDVAVERGLLAIHREVVRAVPSCTSVSLVLAGVDGELVCTVGAADGLVRASLAVPIASGDRLVLRASVGGAFLLLADDLAAAMPEGAPALDDHLAFDPAASAARLGAALAERRWTAIATGVLIEEGHPPEAAAAELERRATAAGTSVAAAARAMVEAAAPSGDAEEG